MTTTITDKMFIGVEAEGPHQGIHTLFVPNLPDLTIDRILYAARVAYKRGVKHIYFGAGNKYGLHPCLTTSQGAKFLIELTEDFRLFCEVNDLAELAQYFRRSGVPLPVEFIFTFLSEGHAASASALQHVKIVDKLGNVVWWALSDLKPYFTSFAHDGYKTDIPIMEGDSDERNK